MEDKTLLDFTDSWDEGFELVVDGKTKEYIVKLWYDSGCVYTFWTLDEFLKISNSFQECVKYKTK